MLAWVKVVHISFIIFWMAGLLYLPRLFVYHTTTKFNTEAYKMLLTMEKKLICIIMIPAFIVSFISGFFLVHLQWAINEIPVRIHIKGFFVGLMFIFNIYLVKYHLDFKKNQNKKSNKFFRTINEVPSFLCIIIVSLAVVKTIFN